MPLAWLLGILQGLAPQGQTALSGHWVQQQGPAALCLHPWPPLALRTVAQFDPVHRQPIQVLIDLHTGHHHCPDHVGVCTLPASSLP